MGRWWSVIHHCLIMFSSITFLHPERLWLAGLWLAVLLVVLLVGYRNLALRGWRKGAALGCKTLLALLLAVCVLDPVQLTETVKQGANEVIVLVDNSASLNMAEMPGSPTRGEVLKAALAPDGKAWPAWMEELRKTFRVRLQSVDERVRAIGDASALDFTGGQSSLASAVMTARDRRASSVAAVVLISDGNATDVAAWTAAAKDQAAPVFPVQVGEASPGVDLSLAELSSQQTTFEDSPVSITAKVTQSGFEGKEVALCVLDAEGKTLITEKHRFAAGSKSHVFRPRLAVAKPGVSFFQIIAIAAEHLPLLKQSAEWQKVAGEATLVNNTRTLAVDRGAGPYRILYVGGRPNWDHKFLRRAMALDPEVQLPSIIRLARREPKFEFKARDGESSNPLFRGFSADQQSEAQRYDQPVLTRLGTKDKEELVDGFPKTPELLMSEYRAIILDDLEAEFFTQEQMNLIERFVSKRGGSLLMLGGMESYQPGGYENTLVGRMLPVYLDKLGATSAVEDGKFSLTREGWLEPWTRLRTEQVEDEQRLAAMPSFWSVNQSTSIKPGATVLATVTDAQQRQFPALVMQRYGTGRVLSLMVGDVWRWGMKDAEQHADMDKSWRQLLRWLVTDVPDRIELSHELSLISGQHMAKLAVRVHDAAFRMQDDASVQIEVQAPNEKPVTVFAEPSLKEPGLFEAEDYPRAAGGYRMKVTVKDSEGKVIGEKTTGFALNPMAEEMASLAPNTAFLQRLAQETGGQVLALKDAAKLADLLPKLEVPQMDRRSQPLWHNGWWLLAMVLLLAGEWTLRRAGGEV